MQNCHKNVQLARDDNSGRIYRVYADGVFDLFHLGHMRVLEQAKKALGDPAKVTLICGVCTDEDVHKWKGKTVMDHSTRVATVSHCRWVDEVVDRAPWQLTPEFLEEHKIDFVAHDAIPYVSAGSEDVYAFIKKAGKFLETQRTEGISTSDLIVAIVKCVVCLVWISHLTTRIHRDYDDYVERNLARGYTKEQLNVGRSWEFRSNIHAKDRQLRSSVELARHELKSTSEAVKHFIEQFSPSYLLVDDQHSDHHQHESDNQAAKRRRKSVPHVSPKAYVQHLRETLPPQSNELLTHGVGLAKAVISTTFSALSYLNFFSYCRPRK